MPSLPITASAAWLLSLALLAVTASTHSKETAVRTAEPPVLTAPALDSTVASQHRVVIDGHALEYQARAGTLVIHDGKGRADAAFFHVAYTVQPAKGAGPRPITFLFNGGPGSSTVWLHMGAVGPVRVHTLDAQANGPAPYQWGANPYSLLDRSDLVFVDAIGTGYSTGLVRDGDGDGDPSKRFWGTDSDIDAFARFVQAYVAQHQRWNSPKFLFGESYGTVRAVGVARQLQENGIELNGIVLMSSILNFGARLPGLDHEFVHTLPTFAAIAWHHGRVQGSYPDQAAFLQEVRRFAREDYAIALAEGNTLAPARAAALAERLAAHTGLPAALWRESNLRVGIPRFRKELLRGQALAIGRYDARFLGIEPEQAGDVPDADASSTAIQGAFTAALNDYLGGTLGYRDPRPYRIKAPLSGQWNWAHAVPGAQGPVLPVPLPVMTVDLATTLRGNPQLKVLSANGLYDLSTPFSAAEYDLAHLQISPALRSNITLTYYPAGHMMYLEPGSLRALRQDLVQFYAAALPAR